MFNRSVTQSKNPEIDSRWEARHNNLTTCTVTYKSGSVKASLHHSRKIQFPDKAKKVSFRYSGAAWKKISDE